MYQPPSLGRKTETSVSPSPSKSATADVRGVASAVMKAVNAVDALEAITGTLVVQFCLVLVASFTPPVMSVLREPKAIDDVDDFFVTMSLKPSLEV